MLAQPYESTFLISLKKMLNVPVKPQPLNYVPEVSIMRAAEEKVPAELGTIHVQAI